MMKLINRSKQSPVGRRACDAVLAAHHEKFGDYGRQKHVTNYTVVVDGVATAMIGVRKLRNLPAQAN